MKRKIMLAIAAMLVLGLTIVAYAYNSSPKHNHDKAMNCCSKGKDSCPMKNKSDSAEKKDCCDNPDCCCKGGDSCPMKKSESCPMKNKSETSAQTVDTKNVTVATSGENCCQTGAACCKDGGTCCKKKG